MKNQYFGDVNDYKKYGLLRLLSGWGELETAICWILTLDDDTTDGHRIRYLEQPEKWRGYDPILYECLRELVVGSEVRNVRALEQNSILPNCRFYSEVMQDDRKTRQRFFQEFLDFAHGADLVFFDPDNGLEVKSAPMGRKKSSKYVYWSEVEATYSAGHSLLIYQHLPRRPRETFIHNIVSRFHTITGARRVFSYCTDHVVFFLFPRPEHEERLTDNNSKIADRWGEKVVVCEHPPAYVFYSGKSL